jgi:hypothetical protein
VTPQAAVATTPTGLLHWIMVSPSKLLTLMILIKSERKWYKNFVPKSGAHGQGKYHQGSKHQTPAMPSTSTRKDGKQTDSDKSNDIISSVWLAHCGTAERCS